MVTSKESIGAVARSSKIAAVSGPPAPAPVSMFTRLSADRAGRLSTACGRARSTAVIARIGQKRLPHPEQVVPVLAIERPGRIDTGMNEEAPAIVVVRAERTHPIDVPGGEFRRRRDAIAPQCRVTAVGGHPLVDLAGIVDRRQREVLVIAAKADHGAGLAVLEIDQILDNAAAVRPAIDVVAEEDELGRSVAGVALASRDQLRRACSGDHECR